MPNAVMAVATGKVLLLELGKGTQQGERWLSISKNAVEIEPCWLFSLKRLCTFRTRLSKSGGRARKRCIWGWKHLQNLALVSGSNSACLGVEGLHALRDCRNPTCKGQCLPVRGARQTVWGESRGGHTPAFGGVGLEEPNAFAVWDMDACAEATWVLLIHVL